MQQKKTPLPLHLRNQYKKEFDLLRNQYEFRNRGMFDMVYPILDEITLDPNESLMKPYEKLLQ